MKKIILASGSPRRKMLMQWAELEFTVVVSDTDETPDPLMDPEDMALDIAKRKNQAVAAMVQDQETPIIISADTMVVLEENVIGKPKDREDAIATLGKLSAQRHQVITGVCISDGDKILSFADTTHVQFHPLTLSQIEHYVDQYAPYDKAGAYAIQEWIGVVGIHSIEGDFYNVMGLPISRVLQHLQQTFFYFKP